MIHKKNPTMWIASSTSGSKLTAPKALVLAMWAGVVEGRLS